MLSLTFRGDLVTSLLFHKDEPERMIKVYGMLDNWVNELSCFRY